MKSLEGFNSFQSSNFDFMMTKQNNFNMKLENDDTRYKNPYSKIED